jgi:hypothetical protein
VWLKVDDQFHAHRKVIGVPLASLGLWVRCGSWAGAALSDGVVDAPIVRQYGGRARETDPLVEAGLWIPLIGGGFVMHDFLEWNPSAEQVKAERSAGKRRAEEARLRRAEQQGRLWGS